MIHSIRFRQAAHLLIKLSLVHLSWAFTIVDPSCSPYQPRIDNAISESRSMAYKAWARLGDPKDREAQKLYGVFMGPGKPDDEIRSCRGRSTVDVELTLN